LSFVEENDFAPLIRSIYEAQDGSFWFGWNNGLVKYNLETKEKIIFRHESGNNKKVSAITKC
jgi:ligand-binding sensor domain-containing protein